MNFCTPGSLKIKVFKKKKKGEIALVLKVSFVCVNPEMGEWAGRGWRRQGRNGDYHDCNSMLKYLLALTAEKCVGNCRGSQGLEQINKKQTPGAMFGSDLVSSAVRNQRKPLPACCSAFLGLADPCLLSLDNHLLGGLDIGWMFWPYWNGEEQYNGY